MSSRIWIDHTRNHPALGAAGGVDRGNVFAKRSARRLPYSAETVLVDRKLMAPMPDWWATTPSPASKSIELDAESSAFSSEMIEFALVNDFERFVQ